MNRQTYNICMPDCSWCTMHQLKISKLGIYILTVSLVLPGWQWIHGDVVIVAIKVGYFFYVKH